MLLKEKNGIVCDLCKLSQRDDFTYYALEGSWIGITPKIKLIQRIRKDIDVDICAGCFNDIKELMSKHLYSTVYNVKCESCGKFCKEDADKNGSYLFMQLVLHKVDVKIMKEVSSNNPSFSRNIDEAVLDVNYCKDCTIKLDNRLTKSKKEIVENVWT